MSFSGNRRLGRFWVTDQLMDEPHGLLPVMARCVPVDVRSMPWEGAWVFTAWSQDFEVVPEGGAIPKYNWLFTLHDDGAVSVRAEKID